MSDQIVMPRLSDSMEEGTIVRWLKADGEHVDRGEELVEIETDKATITYEAPAGGVLSVIVSEGSSAAVGEAIALLKPDDAPATRGDGSRGQTGHQSQFDRGPLAGVTASPVARRTAQRLGIDLALVAGGETRQRVTKADVIAFASQQGRRGSATTEPSAAPVTSELHEPGFGPIAERSKGGARIVRPSRGQLTIARRMASARATVPDFDLTVDVDVSAVFALRDQLRETVAEPPSLNDFVVKASALALCAHPRVNGAYRDGVFELYERVNVAVAVAGEDTLVAPVVFDADQKSIGVIAAEIRRLADQVRANRITPPDLAGATFTVSNLGMFGIDRFNAIINPPQAAILAVGRAAPRAIALDNGTVAARTMMTVTLACDHRVLSGVDGARFLSDVKANLERPLVAFL